MILTKSREYAGKGEIDLDFVINEKIRLSELNTLLLIVPTNRKIRYLKRELISLSPGQASPAINLESIGTYSAKLLFGGRTAPGRILTETASTVLLKQCFQEAKLRYFSHHKNQVPSGTLERIKNVIAEYKRHGVSPGMLKEEAENLEGAEMLKAADITRIYELYQEKCNKLNVMETGDIYRQLNMKSPAEFQLVFRQLYPDVNIVIINGFDEFTSPEINIIDSTASAVKLFLSFDYFKNNPLIFSHLDRCYRKLEAKGFKQIKDISRSSYSRFQSAVREKLFKPAAGEKIRNSKPAVTKINAGTREKEVELIAKEIRDLIIEKKVEPHKICVVFNLIQNYSPVVRDIFTGYGIPFNLTDRFPLSTTSPVISVINFLEIMENDFFYKNIFRAFSGRHIEIGEINLSYLLKSSVDLKVISGYRNWISSLEDAVMEKSEDDNDYRKSFNKQIYRKSIEDLKLIHSFLAPFRGKLTVREFQNHFNDLLFKLKVHNSLINDYGSAVEKNVKALTTFIDNVNELLELLSEEYSPEEKFPLRFFLNNIRTAVSSARFNIKEKPGYGVQITTPNEIRGLKFDYLFISGMCDGDFPTRYQPEIFLSGSYFINEQNHQTEERYHFYQSLCSGEKGLYFSVPSREESKELIESNFLSEFAKLFYIECKNEDNYSQKIYSREELLKYFGETQRNMQEFNGYLEEETIKSTMQKIEVSRLREIYPFEPSAYTGFITDTDSVKVSEFLKKRLKEYRDKQFSVSQLEAYALCPYKYFAERVLNLEPVEEPTEEIEALEMGSLLHLILYRFYSELKEKGIRLCNCSAEIFIKAESIIFRIAEECLKEAHFSSPLNFYEKEKILGINSDRKKSILYEFLLAEREKEGGYIPEFFELSFGNYPQTADAQGELFPSGDFKANGVALRGKIDRLDINPAGKQFKIIDYKLSGKKQGLEKDLSEGLSLQLPLYMFIAGQIIKKEFKKDFEPGGAEIYSLRYKEKEFGGKEIKTLSQSSKEIIHIALNAVESYVKGISEGKFNLSTLADRENKVCRFCSFKSLCRIGEAAVK